MTEALVLLGATCIVAAVIGGGLKVARVAEIPLIDSRPRQAALAVVGVGLIVFGLLIDTDPPPDGPGPDDGSTEQGTGEPTLTLTRSSGPPGTSLRVGGDGFAGDEAVTIRFHQEQVATARTDAEGAFGGETIVIPAQWPFDGSFAIIATGERSGAAAQSAFVVPPAAVKLTPARGSPGTEVRVVGTGFAAGEDVDIEFHLDRLATAPANSDGRFSRSVRIPASWPFDGEFDIRATGQTSRRTADQPFEIE